MYDTDTDTDTSYQLEDIAERHEAENYESGTKHTASTLASSLYTASEIIGHNNSDLVKAVGIAQQLVGNTENLTDNLKPFEVDDTAYDEGNDYLQNLKEVSKVCLSQSKMMKSDEVIKFRDIDRLISNVGTADNYNKVVF